MYKNLVENNIQPTIETPETIVPTPNQSAYSDGYITRYFAQKVNDKSSYVFEISKSTISKLEENPYWSTVQLKWRITGPLNPIYNQNGMAIDLGVTQSNLNEISKASKTIPNLKSYLINTLQFYKQSIL